METARWIKQIYGYLVCLVAVVTVLVSARGLVEAGMDLSNPMYAQSRFGPPVTTSFEAYLATYRERPSPPGADADTASVETLRARWEALREDQVRSVRYDATRSLATSGLLILLSALLFGFHWRWLQRQERPPGGESGH